MGKKNKKKRAKSKKLVWLEWIAWGVSLWFIFYPDPYKILLVILLLLPIIGMLLNSKNEPSICSLVTINNDKNAKRKYDLVDFIDIPAWAILLRFLLDFEIDSYSLLFIFGTISLLFVILVLFFTHKLIRDSSKNKSWPYLIIVFNIFVYSYGATGAINCAFDTSSPIVYETEVIDKRISRGSKGRKTYYVEVNPWGHHLDSESISVTQNQYEKIENGETVHIDYKKGFLGIPWYYIE